MSFTTNKIIAGDYKGADIKYKMIGKKLILQNNIGLFKNIIELNKRTIEHIELVDKSLTGSSIFLMKNVQVTIYFRDGKRSLASMYADFYQELNRVLF